MISSKLRSGANAPCFRLPAQVFQESHVFPVKTCQAPAPTAVTPAADEGEQDDEYEMANGEGTRETTPEET